MTATIDLEEFKSAVKWNDKNRQGRLIALLTRDRTHVTLLRAMPDTTIADGWTEAEAPIKLWQRSIRVREDVGEPSVISLAWVK